MAIWLAKVEDFVIGEQNSAVHELTTGIQNKDFTLLDLVEALGLHLTSKDTHRRCRATCLLAQAIHGLPKDCLLEKEGKVLVTFFCDRLKDHHSVTPHVLSGLSSVAMLPQLTEGDLHTLLRCIYREVHLQTLAQGDRRQFYNMMEYILQRRIADLKKLGGDMVYGFMQAMDAEKDPRNLVIAFRCASLIAQHFPVGMFAEEYFEVVSCYFPIDFTPPPNDPYGISKEELVVGLRNVFASSPKFAEFAYPLLLEKLQSTILNSKIDSLHTLASCAETYGSKILTENVNSFWNCIRREVFTPVSDVLERASLAALTAISKTLASDKTAEGNPSVLEGFLQDIFKDLKKHLCEPELRLMYPCSKLLLAAGAGSNEACCIVMKHVIPLLQEQFVKHQQSIPRRNILDIMNNFITLTKDVTTNQDKNCPLAQYKNKLFSLYVSVVSDSNHQLRILAGQGLVAMASLGTLLSRQDVETVINHLTSMVLRDADHSVRKESINGISSISQMDNYDQFIQQSTVTKLVTALNEEPMEVDNEIRSNSARDLLLEGLVTLSTTTLLVQSNVNHLMDHLSFLSTGAVSDEVLHEARTTCNCVQNVLDNHIHRPDCVDIFRKDVLIRCWDIVIKSCCSATYDVEPVLLNKAVMVSLAGLCRTIVSHLTDCDAIVSSVCQIVLKGDTSAMSCDIEEFGTISSSTKLQLQLIPLFNAVTCCTKNPLEETTCDEILNHLNSFQLNTFDCSSSTNIIMCISTLLNRLPEGEYLEKWLQVIDKKLSAEGTREPHELKTACDLLVWISKATVMRGYRSQQKYAQKLLSQLENKIVADTCAEGFRIILEDNPNLLNNSTHANVKLMYRQRFFLQTLPALIEGFNTAQADMKQYYQKALSYHLKYVPKEAILPELPKLLPLVIQSLSIEETSLLQSTLSTIMDLIEHSSDIIVSYVDDIIPRLLSLSHYKQSMKVRMAALQCLSCMTSLPHHVIYPHQNEVTRSLATSLDDHKRLVRKEAVTARSNWFLIGTSK